MLEWTLVILLATVILLTLVIVVARVARAQTAQRHARAMLPARRLLIAVAAGEDDDGAAARTLADLPPDGRPMVDQAIVQMLSKVSGAPARALVEVLRSHGRDRWAREGLTSRSSVRRAHAAWTLGLMRDAQELPALVPLLSDRSADVRITAARAVGMIGDAAATSAVLAAVPPVAGRTGLPLWVSTEALISLGHEADPALRVALGDTRWEIRLAAATVVTHVPVYAALRDLRERIDQEPVPTVRAELCLGLGQIGGAADVPLLGARLGDAETPVRLAAARALGHLADGQAVHWLEPALADEVVQVAEAAAIALSQVGPKGRAVLTERAEAGSRVAAYGTILDQLQRNRPIPALGGGPADG